jgi:hypothetical protein
VTTPTVAVGLLSWALSALFTGASALLLSNRLRTSRISLDLAAFVFLWIWATTFLTFALGLVGRLSAGSLGIISLFGLTALYAIRPTRRALSQETGVGRELLRAVRHMWRGLPLWLRFLTIGFVAFGTLRFGLLIWGLPPFVWDSLTYHLTNVAQWIQDGRIGLFITPVQRIYSPANYEVLASWFAVFLHHDAVIEAAGLPSYVLAGLSVYAIARALNLSPVGSWVATLAYLSTPALVYAATGTKNDPFVAATFLFLAALVLHLRESIDVDVGGSVTSYIILFLVGLTYALGTKSYALQLAAGLAVLAVAPGFGSGVGAQWRKGRGRLASEWRTMSRRARVLLLGLVGCAVFLGGFWNVRNWVLVGNPFYPYEVAFETGGTISLNSASDRLRRENLLVLGMKFETNSRGLSPISRRQPDGAGWCTAWVWWRAPGHSWWIGGSAPWRLASVAALVLMASNTTSPGTCVTSCSPPSSPSALIL